MSGPSGGDVSPRLARRVTHSAGQGLPPCRLAAGAHSDHRRGREGARKRRPAGQTKGQPLGVLSKAKHRGADIGRVPMDIDRGPLRTYELTWHSGHVETVRAHQVAWPNRGFSMFTSPGTPEPPSRITFHAEIDGHWTLILSALEEDLRTVRDVTTAEALDGA